MSGKLLKCLDALKIRTKLLIFMIIPTVVLSYFVLTASSFKWQEFQQAKNANNLVRFSADIADLVHELQKERGLSAGYAESQVPSIQTALQAQRQLTDDRLVAFLERAQLQKNLGVSSSVFELETQLDKLASVRATIDRPGNTNNFFDYYSDLNTQVLHSVRVMDKLINRSQTGLHSRQAELYMIVLWLMERSGQERAMFNRAIRSGELSQELSSMMRLFYMNQKALLEKYSVIASVPQQAQMQEKIENPIVKAVDTIRNNIASQSEKAVLLDRLLVLLNVGGVINSVDSYGGARQQQRVDSISSIYAEALTLMERYRALGEASALEVSNLDNINTMFEKHVAVSSASLMEGQPGLPNATNDSTTTMDDGSALESIATLKNALMELDADESWEMTTKRIELFQGISNNIQQEMLDHAIKVSEEDTRALIMYFLIMAITLLTMVALGYVLLRRLVGEISTISTSMRTMQDSNNLDQLLPVSGNDEISDMARSFNTLILERHEINLEVQTLSRAVESSSSHIVITDLEGVIQYVNQQFVVFTGYSKDDAIGQKMTLLKSGHTTEKTYAQLWTAIKSGKDWRGELENKNKQGDNYWTRTSISCVKNAKGEITNYISFQEDITHEYQLTQQLNYQACHDSLTGLINRREFEVHVERLLESGQDRSRKHAICFMDLDQFKVVNDSCGHAAGDELLRQISIIINDQVRSSDVLARLGGDEFGILMAHCSLEQARRVSTLILEAVRDYQFIWDENYFKIGISIGLVAIDESIVDLTELFKEADAACYMAKESGRNRIHVYSPDDEEIVQRQGEMQWVTRIQRALEENSFCLYAQAIEPLDKNTGQHFELLIRMLDDNGEIIPPGAFLPAAERYSLISQLDRWTVNKAFSLLIAHPVFIEKVHFVSINLSGPSLADDTFLDFVISKVSEWGVDGEKICFEITETAAISNLGRAIKFISTLRGLGCRFALDDFGSGLSSFGYLKNLPIDYLKIDGMFVKDIIDDPIDRAMVKSINDIGQVMGMETIAEFVENDAIRRKLKELGVNYAQGYGVAKPVPFEALLVELGPAIEVTGVG